MTGGVDQFADFVPGGVQKLILLLEACLGGPLFGLIFDLMFDLIFDLIFDHIFDPGYEPNP